jgi:Flp pilus assembly pilin Flp
VTNLSIAVYAWFQSVLMSAREERGQDLLEYALLGGLIAAGIVAVLALMTGNINEMVTNIGKCIDFDKSAGSTCAPGF